MSETCAWLLLRDIWEATVNRTYPRCAAISAYGHQRLINIAGLLKTAQSAITILLRSASCWHSETKRC